MDDVLAGEIGRLCASYDRSGDAGFLDQAEDLARGAAAVDAESLVVLAGLDERRDNKSAAGAAYHRAGELEADRGKRCGYLINALECYANCAEVEQALSVVRMLLDEDRSEEGRSRLLPIVLLLPELATQLGRHGEAGAAYLAAARHSSMDREARYELLLRALQSFQAAEAPEEALEVARQCVAERPDDRVVTQTTIRLLALLDRGDEAVELLDQSVSRFPELARFGKAASNGFPLSVLAGQRGKALSRILPPIIAHGVSRLGASHVLRGIGSALDAPLPGTVVESVCGAVDGSIQRSQEAAAALRSHMSHGAALVGNRLRDGISALRTRLQPLREGVSRSFDDLRHGDTKQPGVLYAFYDLAVSPATFDVVTFLVLAEAERQRTGSVSLHVVVVPGPNEGFRADTAPYEVEEKRWRVRNIVVPCCWLIPQCVQVSVCSSRDEARALEASLARKVFPLGYTVRFPKEHYDLRHLMTAAAHGTVPSLKASPGARDFVNQWIQREAGGRKVITVSLRECGYQHRRNSNLGAWGEFARRLDGREYFPVVIRDMAKALDVVPHELDGLCLFSEGPWTVELRLALYESSYLNMFVSMGPLALAMLSHGTRYLAFKPITAGEAASAEKYFRERGLEPGSQPPMLKPYQRWVWDDDGLEAIEAAFGDMCEAIEGASEERRELAEGEADTGDGTMDSPAR